MRRLHRGWWGWLTRPPAVVDPAAVTRSNGLLYIGCGFIAALVTFFQGGPTEGHAFQRLSGVLCIAIGLALLISRVRLGRVRHHLIVIPAWACPVMAIIFSGDRPYSLTIASYFVIVMVNMAAVSSWLVCAAYLLLNLGCLIGSLLAVGMENAAGVVNLSGTLVLMSVFVGIMVRATARAQIDPLTGLLNQRGLHAQLTVTATSAGRSATPLCLALIELDHFKTINETQGYAAGDQVLRTVARTWTSMLPAGAVLGRWGGDEFAILMTTGEDELTALVDTLRHQLPQGLTCTAGTAEHEDGESASMLLGRAEAAVYQAKRTARGTTAGHSGAVAAGRPVLAALADNQIEVHYQPVIGLSDGRVTGAEALVRWRDPQRGLVPPDSFIPQAEVSGVIVDLGRYIVRASCREAATWPRLPDGTRRRVNVNVTGRELAEEDYAAYVLASLQEFSLPPAALVVEITEGVLDTGSLTVTANLTALREAGIQLALDDFGTGHSSLSRLAQLDIAILKVDRSFISPIQRLSDTAPLVSAVLGLAAAMDLDVVAEGIETAEQEAWLRAAGCQKVQGYRYSKALPASEFGRWLAAYDLHRATPPPSMVAR